MGTSQNLDVHSSIVSEHIHIYLFVGIGSASVSVCSCATAVASAPTKKHELEEFGEHDHRTWNRSHLLGNICEHDSQNRDKHEFNGHDQKEVAFTQVKTCIHDGEN